MSAQGYAAYKQTQVTTASGGRLIVMLYDAAVNHLNRSLEALDARAYQDVHNSLVKVQDILTELMSALDMQYEISQSLYALYDYCIERLVAANIAKDAEPVKEVLGYMTELRDTWQQAIQGHSAGQQAAQRPQAVNGNGGGIEISG